MVTEFRNVGSYMVIERIDRKPSFGEGVCYGVVKYHSSKSNVERIYENGVTYLESDVVNKMIIDSKEYDLVLYYNIILNLVYIEDIPKENKLAQFEGINTV